MKPGATPAATWRDVRWFKPGNLNPGPGQKAGNKVLFPSRDGVILPML
jgi:hypothetical protein